MEERIYSKSNYDVGCRYDSRQSFMEKQELRSSRTEVKYSGVIQRLLLVSLGKMV